MPNTEEQGINTHIVCKNNFFWESVAQIKTKSATFLLIISHTLLQHCIDVVSFEDAATSLSTAVCMPSPVA